MAYLWLLKLILTSTINSMSMKNTLTTILLIFSNWIILLAGSAFSNKSNTVEENINLPSLGCAPSPSDIKSDDNGKFITVLPGWGKYNYTISTKSDSTQFYFNQGLNFYYSYHFREALASFKEASRFDPSSAMCYWGQALSMGPNYNDYYYKMRIGVLAVIDKMTGSMESSSNKEQALIRAMQKRYSSDTTNTDRKQLDSNYANALLSLTTEYKNDVDIKALYIDAVMLSHKWDFWYNNGMPKPWTNQVKNFCEDILTRSPLHPAALHYYIHITEASKDPSVALANADKLKTSLPGIGHMVHMATHMYQRNGLFAKGATVNDDAITANNIIDSLAPHLGIGRNSNTHFFAVQSYCALTAGIFKKATPLYFRLRNKIMESRLPVEKDAYTQFLYMVPVIAWTRLGKWDTILQSPAVNPNWKYAAILDDFARGLANIRKNNLSEARVCLDRLEKNLSDSLLAIRLMPFNRPVQCGRIAAGILKGEILGSEGKSAEAIAAFNLAVKEEDLLIYREPQDWMIPARQFLGVELLKMKRPKEAEIVYNEDLIANPGNGWSLFGMYQSLKAQNKKSSAATYKIKYIKAFKDADIVPRSSVF